MYGDVSNTGEPRIRIPRGQFLTVRLEFLDPYVVQILQLLLPKRPLTAKDTNPVLRPLEQHLPLNKPRKPQPIPNLPTLTKPNHHLLHKAKLRRDSILPLSHLL